MHDGAAERDAGRPVSLFGVICSHAAGSRSEPCLAAPCARGWRERRNVNSGYIWLLGTALSWSFSGIFSKLNGQPGFLISAVSSCVALAFYLIIIRPTIRVNKLVAAAGVAAYLMGITFTYANKMTSVGSAIVLQYSSTAFVALYTAIDERRLPPARKVFVIVMALAGMVVFFFDSLSPERIAGNMLAIVSGAFFGLMFFLNARPGSSPVTSSMMSCVLSLVPGLAFLPRLPQVTEHEWLLMIAAGIICTGIANVCFSRGVTRVDPLSANLITMLEVIMAPLWAFFIFGESLGRFAFAGAVLIIGSIVVDLLLEYRERAGQVATAAVKKQA